MDMNYVKWCGVFSCFQTYWYTIQYKPRQWSPFRKALFIKYSDLDFVLTLSWNYSEFFQLQFRLFYFGGFYCVKKMRSAWSLLDLFTYKLTILSTTQIDSFIHGGGSKSSKLNIINEPLVFISMHNLNQNLWNAIFFCCNYCSATKTFECWSLEPELVITGLFSKWNSPRLCDLVSLWGIRNHWGSRSEIRFPGQRAEDKPCVFLTANTIETPSFCSFFPPLGPHDTQDAHFLSEALGFYGSALIKNYNAINVAKHTWGSRSELLWPWLKKYTDP